MSFSEEHPDQRRHGDWQDRQSLGILGKFIPEDERILLIEDTAEIRMSHTESGSLRSPPGTEWRSPQSRSATC